MLLMLFCCIIVLLVGLVCLYMIYILIREGLSPICREYPGYTLKNPVFGNTMDRPELNFFQRWAYNVKRYGRLYRYYTYLGQAWLVIVDPEAIRRVLVTNSKNYIRGPLTGVEAFQKIVGDSSMLVTDGEIHKKHRLLASPAFKLSNIKGFLQHIQLSTEKLINNWLSMVADKDHCELEIRREMSRVTLTIIGLACFGFDFGCIENDNSPLVKSLEQIIGVGQKANVWDFLPYVCYIPSKRTKSLWSGVSKLRSMLAKIAAIARESECNNTLLTKMSKATLDDGKMSFSDTELTDEMMTFILAGHETSSLALTYAIWLLSNHPASQEKCQKEIRQVLGEPGSKMTPLSWEVFEALPYTKAVIYETLRLFPPIPFVPRTSIAEDTLYGYHIPANTSIGILIAQMQRLPEIWSDPEKFVPERFLQKSVPWDAWMPFGDGRHKCLGNKFALTETTAVLAMLLRNFWFFSQPNRHFNMRTIVTLQPADPVLICFERLTH